MIGLESQCDSCVHCFPDGSADAVPVCAAFPAGIPPALLDNEADHREPYPGDGGVRWDGGGDPFPEDVFAILRELRALE